jgi:MerR family transcriptional regulator, light-induced transcriptional regulator
MTELNETAPPPAGFGSTRPGRTGFGTGLERHHPPLIVRGTTVSHLSTTIEAEIIPRLVMAHGSDVKPINERAVRSGDSDATAFAELILGPENNRAAAQIQTYRDRGIALETIYLQLFVPAARHLRHLWMNDDRDFADITLGLWRLQQLLRDLSPAFCAEAPIRSVGLRSRRETRHQPHDVRAGARR